MTDLASSQHGKKTTLSASHCMSVLKLSTEWRFHSVRQSMIEELLPYTQDDPVLKIIAARKYDISEWLVPGVNALAQREDALSESDAQRFQDTFDDTLEVMKLVLNIGKVRESWFGQPPGCRSKHDFTKAICTVFACDINGRKMAVDVAISSKVPELVESANATHQRRFSTRSPAHQAPSDVSHGSAPGQLADLSTTEGSSAALPSPSPRMAPMHAIPSDGMPNGMPNGMAPGMVPGMPPQGMPGPGYYVSQILR
jgi:hypothetical protein